MAPRGPGARRSPAGQAVWQRTDLRRPGPRSGPRCRPIRGRVDQRGDETLHPRPHVARQGSRHGHPRGHPPYTAHDRIGITFGRMRDGRRGAACSDRGPGSVPRPPPAPRPSRSGLDGQRVRALPPALKRPVVGIGPIGLPPDRRLRSQAVQPEEYYGEQHTINSCVSSRKNLREGLEPCTLRQIVVTMMYRGPVWVCCCCE